MHHRLAAAVIALAIAGPAAASAQPAPAQTPFIGKWHWNRAESTSLISGEAVPNDVVLAIASADRGRVRWTLTAVDAKGETHVQSFDGRGDGSAAPVAGAPDGAMASFTVTPTGFQGHYTNRDGSSERTDCTVSADRAKMSCRGTEADAKGRTRAYTDVYDRR